MGNSLLSSGNDNPDVMNFKINEHLGRKSSRQIIQGNKKNYLQQTCFFHWFISLIQAKTCWHLRRTDYYELSYQPKKSIEHSKSHSSFDWAQDERNLERSSNGSDVKPVRAEFIEA